MLLTKEQFLDRVKRNNFYCDNIDAFYIIHFYHEDDREPISTSLSNEDELSLMLYRLLGYNVDEEDFLRQYKKKCCRCKREFELHLFTMNMESKDRRCSFCRFCGSKDPVKAYENYLTNEELTKKCRVCKKQKTLNNFKIGGAQTLYGRRGTCKSCQKTIDENAKERNNSPDVKKSTH
jgi:hypothetical protein